MPTFHNLVLGAVDNSYFALTTWSWVRIPVNPSGLVAQLVEHVKSLFSPDALDILKKHIPDAVDKRYFGKKLNFNFNLDGSNPSSPFGETSLLSPDALELWRSPKVGLQAHNLRGDGSNPSAATW